MSRKKKKRKRRKKTCPKCWDSNHMTSAITYLSTGVKHAMCSKCGHIDRKEI